jgi:hypothetical protein
MSSRNSAHFVEPKSLLPYSHECGFGLYPAFNKWSPHPKKTISLRSVLILSCSLRLGLPSGVFPLVFPTRILYAHVTHACRISVQSYPSSFDNRVKVYSRSQWPSGLRRWPKAARLLGLLVSIPLEAWKFACLFKCRVLSGRGLCHWLFGCQ